MVKEDSHQCTVNRIGEPNLFSDFHPSENWLVVSMPSEKYE